VAQNQVEVGSFRIPVATYNKTGDVVVGVRPEDITICTEQPGDCSVEFTAYSVMPSGAETTLIARRGDTELTIKEIGVSKIQMDQRIWLTFKDEAINLYDKTTEKLITN